MRLKSAGWKWTEMQLVGEGPPGRVVSPYLPGETAQSWLLPVPARKAATQDPGHREAF